MNKLTRRIINGLIILIAAIATVACFVFFFKPDMFAFLDMSFYIIYILGIISIAAIVFFTIWQIVRNKKQLKTVLIIIVIAAIDIVAAWLLASPQLSEKAISVGISGNMFLFCGTLLNLAYIVFFELLAVALATFVFVKIKNR
jgi:hypothetical protein